MAPGIHTLIASLSTRLHLLDTLPGVLTYLHLAGHNIFVDKHAGTLTGVIDFEEARIKAFGINIFFRSLREPCRRYGERALVSLQHASRGAESRTVCERCFDKGVLGCSVGMYGSWSAGKRLRGGGGCGIESEDHQPLLCEGYY